MKALLDTRTFLWSITNDKRLSARAQQIFTGPHDLYLSVASVWEIMLTRQRGRLPMPAPAGQYLVRQLAENHIEVLPIELDHVLMLEELPAKHNDPFDRALIAQSMVEKMPLVSADATLKKYRIELIW